MGDHVKPSRTFTAGMIAALALVFFGVCLIVLAFVHPEQMSAISGPLVACLTGIAAAGGVTAGAMGYRDGKSRGLTSSQAGHVLAANTIRKDAP